MIQPPYLLLQVVLALVTAGVVATIYWRAQIWVTDVARYLRSDGGKGDSQTEDAKNAVVTTAAFVIILICGLFVVAEASLLCFQGSCHMFIAILWAMAATAAGAFLGFLFSIPKAMEGSAGADPKSSQSTPRVNTSLSEISDWLTKIIVGVSLVQARQIYDHFKITVGQLAQGLDGGTAEGKAFAAALLVFFPILGFLASYLLTRLHIAGLISKADGQMSRIQLTGSSEETMSTARASLRMQVADSTLADQRRISAPVADKDLRFNEGIQAVAKKFNSVKFDSLRTWEDFAAWGLSKLARGKPADAVRAYQSAVEREPDNPALLFELATAQEQAGQEQNVLDTLEEAAAKLPRDPDSKLRDDQRTLRNAIYNRLTYKYLYLDKSEARDRAIALAEDFLNFSAPDNPSRGAVLVNLACALGQKAAKDTRPGSPEFQEIQRRAYKASEEAIALDGGWRARLRFLLDVKHPDKLANEENQKENDLEIFGRDPAFRALVGLEA